MTKQEKRRFIKDLVGSVQKDLVANVAKMPADWDGHELRRYIADVFARERADLMPACVRRYNNAILTLNL